MFRRVGLATSIASCTPWVVKAVGSSSGSGAGGSGITVENSNRSPVVSFGEMCAEHRSVAGLTTHALGAQMRFQMGSMRPGDWHCNTCQQHNFKNRTECFKCRAPKGSPAGTGVLPRKKEHAMNKPSPHKTRPGDWECSCGQHNYYTFLECKKCNSPREGSAGEGKDWTCCHCFTINFGRRTSCGGCQFPRMKGFMKKDEMPMNKGM